MKVILWGIIVVVSFIIQVTIMPLLAYQGVKPDLLLIIVVSSGLLLGREQGVSIGFFAGLLQDLAGGNIFGVNTLSKLAIGYLFGMAERKVFKEHILLPVLAMSAATIANSMIAMGILVLLGYQVELWTALVHTVMPLLFYNIIIAIPVHQIIYRVSKIGRAL